MPFRGPYGVFTALLAALLVVASLPADGRANPVPPTSTALKAADKKFRAGYEAVQRNDLKVAEANFAEVVRLTPSVAAGHAAYGSVLLSLGKLAEATRELKTAHALDPDETSATLNLARAYQQSGHTQEATHLFDALSSSDASLTPEDWYAYAELLLAKSDLTSAHAKMLAATEAYPQDATLADTFGVVLGKQQDYVSAELAFRRAEELAPGLAGPHLHLGAALLLQKQAPEAIGELRAAASLRPEDPAIRLELGRALTSDHQDEEATSVLQQALKLASSPQKSALALDIKYALAIALQNGGRNQEALPFFEEVAAAHPSDEAALTNLGLAFVQVGRAKDALPYYDKAQELNAHDWILQQDMGVAYLQQSDLNHAIEHFQNGLTIDPDNAQLHYDLGLALKLKDSLPEAIAAFTKAEAEDPALADTPYTLGVLYMQTGKFAEAQTELRKATSLRPENGDAWSVLGSVDKSLNQPEQAIHDLQTAIQLQPALPGNHVTLAAIYAQQGRHEEAAAERKLAADLNRTAVNKQKSAFALDSGRTLLKRGQVEEAMKQMEAAITADPANAAAHLALADALSTQGKAADAALERQKAAALGPR